MPATGSTTLCRGCGYELAGLAAACTCPECGIWNPWPRPAGRWNPLPPPRWFRVVRTAWLAAALAATATSMAVLYFAPNNRLGMILGPARWIFLSLAVSGAGVIVCSAPYTRRVSPLTAALLLVLLVVLIVAFDGA